MTDDYYVEGDEDDEHLCDYHHDQSPSDHHDNFSNQHSNKQDQKMEDLVTQLDSYSRLGIPKVSLIIRGALIYQIRSFFEHR